MVEVVVVVVVGVALVAAGFWLAVGALRGSVESRMEATASEMRRLADAAFVGERGTGEMRHEVAAVRHVLDRLQVRDEERREREVQAWEALRRVSTLLAGSQRTGRAGENILGEALAHLPPALLERDFRVNGRVVEFALVLADGRRLPIDSKWPAESEVAQLERASEPAERDRIIREIERTVARRAREVAAYRDPAVTAPIAVAAVPDAAYGVLRRAHTEAFRHGVIVVPYSLALPIVLSLHALVSRVGEVGDVGACLADLGAILDSLEATLENKLERAATMLANGTGEVRGHIGQARTALSRVRDVQPGDLEEPPLARLVGMSG
jgi:DNA recombination protein RmuC